MPHPHTAGNTKEPTPIKLAPAKQGLSATGSMNLSPGDRCPVCAMAVIKHEKFSAAIELNDGSTYYFCGPGCMIKSWLHPEVFLGTSKQQLKRAVVREYFSGEEWDALAGEWVAGSDIIGPMGPMMVLLKTAEDVATFRKRHGGNATFKLGKLTDTQWEHMTGKSATHKPSAMP